MPISSDFIGSLFERPLYTPYPTTTNLFKNGQSRSGLPIHSAYYGIFSPYASVRKRKPPQGSFAHLNRASHLPECGCQPSRDSVLHDHLPRVLLISAYPQSQCPSSF